MKRNITLIATALVITIGAMAQPNKQEREERIKAHKIAFITKKLDLTSEEAQQFWPIYNEYEQKLEVLRKQNQTARKSAKDGFNEMSDREVEAVINGEIEFRQTELDIQKSYLDKFKSILPIKKVAKLLKAEREFKKFLLQQIKEMRGNRPMPNGRGGPNRMGNQRGPR